jgi:hypothetical protein
VSAWQGWERDVLHELGLPDTEQNRRFLAVWQRFEGGKAANNPLNTTLNVGGATTYNQAGVRNYPSPRVGARATAATLRNPNYAGVRAALATGDPSQLTQPQREGLFAGLSTWVSGSATKGLAYATRIWGAFTGRFEGPTDTRTHATGRGVVGAVTAVPQAFGWAFANWDRVLEVLGGFALLVFGLLRLSGQTGAPGLLKSAG